MPSSLEQIIEPILGPEEARKLLNVLTIPDALRNESGPTVSRAVVAQALNMVLFEDLLRRVPAARDYVNDCVHSGAKVKHDHGAVRTVAREGMGKLPAGETALTRVLLPLGYERRGVYPLERLKMIGRSYAQADFPEDIAQFFISELFPERFSPEFQAAVARVTDTSIDPLTESAQSLLAKLDTGNPLTIAEATSLVRDLAAAFERQHSIPSVVDYETLLKESAEMAWISTEGNAFNHCTDRVPDVQALTDEQKRLGRPMKDTVEVSGSGRVRQTAFRAATVTRDFRDSDGNTVQRDVPGSFMEFIARDYLPGEENNKKLDLSFDPSNAQAIFKMTATQEAGSAPKQ